MATSDDQVNSISAAAIAVAPPPPIFISAATLHSIITHETLIKHLQSSLPSLSSSVQSPIRHSHETSPASSLLLMPAWSLSPDSFPYIGVKLVTHHPGNSAVNLPGIHAIYLLFNSVTGQTLASIDATDLTLYRTSCISAIASIYLSRTDSEVLVMIGAGALAPHLIRAHLIVRPSIKRVVIWNRSIEKARVLAEKLGSEIGSVRFESNRSLDEAVRMGDIVSCATNSEEALVKAAELKAGAHLDLVGSFKHSMRECDEEVIRRGRVFVDGEAAAMEAGELVGMEAEISGELVELIRGEKIGREGRDETTVFKSVGSAIVDLLSAQLVYESCMK